jgi:CopG family transcriptional regulator, nickel-responsive regulator
MVDRVTRFGVSIPKKTVERFDETIKTMGYVNRSKAISDAIKEFITHRALEPGKTFTGTISYAFDHHTHDINKRLVDIQHGFEENIKATMHSHISHDKCVEVMIVSGETERIKQLYGNISAIKGVENCAIASLEVK